MAIYHFKVKILNRKQNRSAVLAAAYRSGEKLEDTRIGKIADYSRKRQPLYKEIIAPSQTPTGLIGDRQTLWNAVETAELRSDAQVAREIEIALPAELNLEQNINLVKDYVQSQFVSQGMIADVAINRPPKTIKEINVIAIHVIFMLKFY